MSPTTETIYYFPCDCGASIEVAPVQAGEVISCSACGRECQVPSRSSLLDLHSTVRCRRCGLTLEGTKCPKCSAWWRGSVGAGRLGNAYLLIAASVVWLILASVGAYIMAAGNQEKFNQLLPFAPLGYALLFVAGSATWAKTKGYGSFLGIALGLLGPLGLLILVFLPDR